MNFKQHLLSSTTLSLLVYTQQPQAALALTIAGVAIDLDHWLVYALQSGDWSVDGALRYDRYRHLRVQAGDTRPRYGSLRSWAHQPWLVLPPLWWGAQRWPWLRPLALGLSLHLFLDYLYWPGDLHAYMRARWRCERCGNTRRLEMLRSWREGRRRREVVCARCKQRHV